MPGLDQDPLLFVTTDNVRRCGDRGDTSEQDLIDTEISRERCKHVTDGHHEELTTNLLGLSFE